jgi:long-subunit fatty acid transport protein
MSGREAGGVAGAARRPAAGARGALALLAALALTAAATPAAAQTKTGTAIGDFLLIEPSARATGMGNAGVTLDTGLDAVYYNPAAIGQLDRRGALFSHSEWLAGINYNYAGAAMPLRHAGSLFASLTALSSGDIAVRTVEQPQGTGELYHVTDVALGVGFGRRITDRFSAGVQVSYLQETIWHTSASAVVLNLGTLYRLSEDGLRIGASVSNYGTQARFDGRDLRVIYDQDPTRYGDNGALPAEALTDEFPLPVLFRVGVGLPYKFSAAHQVRLAVDAFHPSDNSESVSLGGEYSYRTLLAVRAGYQNLFLKDSEVGLTLGAGLAGDLGEQVSYNIDYAWADQGRLGSTHRVTVGLSF